VDDARLTAQEAADRIGVSARYVREIADRLGGERDRHGRLTFDAEKVDDYAKQRDASSRRGGATTNDLLQELVDEVRGLRDDLRRRK